MRGLKGPCSVRSLLSNLSDSTAAPRSPEAVYTTRSLNLFSEAAIFDKYQTATAIREARSGSSATKAC